MKNKPEKATNIIPFPKPTKQNRYPKGHLFEGMLISTLKKIGDAAKTAASRWK